MVKWIVSQARAGLLTLKMAARSDPGPVGFVFVTVLTVGTAGILGVVPAANGAQDTAVIVKRAAPATAETGLVRETFMPRLLWRWLGASAGFP
jgi:hypothetical protein